MYEELGAIKSDNAEADDYVIEAMKLSKNTATVSPLAHSLLLVDKVSDNTIAVVIIIIVL